MENLILSIIFLIVPLFVTLFAAVWGISETLKNLKNDNKKGKKHERRLFA